MNPNLPASFSQPSQSSNFVLVISQTGNQATVRSSDYPLSEGIIIHFIKPSAKGIVTSVEGNLAQVTLTTTLPCRRGEIIKLFQPAQPPFTLLIPNSQIGSISVNCKTPPNYQSGSIGWSLYYSPSPNQKQKIIVEGHDLNNKSQCYLSNNGTWNAGYYQLTATLYSQPNKNPIKTKSVKWHLAKTNPTLSAGNLNDSLPPLIF